MSAKWERDSEASKGTLTFEIDVETAKKGIDQAFKRTQKRITVPGFRKGHVPRQLFNQMYGEEALYQDALNIVLPKAYEDAVKETGIEPVDQPQIDVKSLEKGQPWVLTAEVAVKPEVSWATTRVWKFQLKTRRFPTRKLKTNWNPSVNNKLNWF